MASFSPHRFPFDDDARPSGSVQPLSQADLQAILAHLGDDPEALLAGTGADRPVVAMRVRASVGRPGGSAQAKWRRARAAEGAAWMRTLPWRVAATLGIGVGGGVLGGLLAPRLGLLLGGLAAIVAGWGLRFRPSPRRQRLAARGGRGAAHRSAARPAGRAWVGGLARPGRSWEPGQYRPLGDRPGWSVRDRLQVVSGPAAAGRGWAAVAWRLPAGPHPAGGVVRGRPGRPGPD